ncbi:MAG TPA: DUF1631 domain-containing protein [Alcanivorax sp.]|nr:DUF1631 domain-containing protein [Alcanivorax sp.]
MSKVTRLKPLEGGKGRAVSLPRPLERVRERITERAGGLLADMLDGADDTLFDLAEKETDSERDRYFDAMRELRLQRGALETGFRQALGNLFLESTRTPDDRQRAADKVAVEDLALVKHEELETTVALDNLARRARKGHDEALRAFQHRLEYLFESKIEITERNNPLEPRNLAACFSACLERLSLDIRARLIVLKLFERVVMDEAGAMVEEANRVLADAGVLPDMKAVPVPRGRPAGEGGGGAGDSGAGAAGSPDQPRAAGGSPSTGGAPAAAPPADNAMFGLLQELLTTLRGLGPAGGAPASGSSAPAGAGTPGPADGAALTSGMAIMHNGVAHLNGAPLTADAPVQAVSSQDLFGLLTRLQRLEHALEGGGAEAQDRSVKDELSDLLESENSEAIHALDQADDDVINLVAMLFDFILDDEGLPSEIKALIGRLQIPLLKVAIADKTFFSNENHDARLLLNTLARAGCQWDPQQGYEDETYQRIHRAVHAIIDDYDEDAALFSELLAEFDAFFSDQRARSERVAERVREAEEGKARAEQASEVVRRYIDARLAGRQVPDVAVRLLRQGWQQVLYLTWLRQGEDSDAWRRYAKVVDALVWSVMPHRAPADLEKLRDLSPKVVRALEHGLESIEYDADETRALLDDLLAVHDSLIKGLETERVAVPKAPEPAPPAPSALPDDHELVMRARHLRAGQWLEIGEGEDAQRAKLAANIRDGAKLVFINRRGIKVREYDAAGLALALHDGDVRLIDDGALFDRALEAVIGDLRRLQNA